MKQLPTHNPIPSPTPWRSDGQWILAHEARIGIAKMANNIGQPAQANAKHIVHCVNQHDALIKCLRDAIHYIPTDGDAERDIREAIEDLLKIEAQL